MPRQLKTTASLRNGDEVAGNVAISEANLCRGSTKHGFYKTFLKNFVKFIEKDLCQSLFFKTFCNFKRRLWHKCFPLNSEIFLKPTFCVKFLQVTPSAPLKVAQKVYKTYR